MHVPCDQCMFGASPTGSGKYTQVNGMSVEGVVDTEASKPGRVEFSGHVKTSKPDGSRYEGGMLRNKREGTGKHVNSIGEVYEGEWRNDKHEGQGEFTSQAASATYVRSHRTNVCAKLVRYKGAWKQGLAHGQGAMEYFGSDSKSGAKHGSNGAAAGKDDERCIWRFVGKFAKGCPASGTLETGDGETYEAEFDGKAKGGDFAAWYWAPKPDTQRIGGTLVDVPTGSEEFRAVSTEFHESMRAAVDSIQRVENDHLRLLYSVEVAGMRARMQARPDHDKSSAQAVDMWAFHGPGGDLALQCIVEEGFQATFSGITNGDLHGTGIYFATTAARADSYTDTKTSNEQCKMLLARIAPGDPCGALGVFAHKSHARLAQFL